MSDWSTPRVVPGQGTNQRAERGDDEPVTTPTINEARPPKMTLVNTPTAEVVGAEHHRRRRGVVVTSGPFSISS